MKTLDELATLANNIEPVNRSRAHDIICDLATGKVHENDQAVLFAGLYAYFMPNTPKKPKTSEQWVNLAMAVNDVRYYLNQAYVAENGDYVCTDGHRCHILSGVDKSSGFYDKALNKVELDGKFPDYERIIPDVTKGSYKVFTLAELNLSVIDNGMGKKKDQRYIISVNDRMICINKKYWDEAVVGFTEKAKYHIGDKDNSILIEEGNKKAVLMPVRQ